MNTIRIGNRTFPVSAESVFQVQVGRNRSAYKNRYTFSGDFNKAAFYYSCINIGNGYKKRFLLDGKVVARAFS